jgi:bifunctional DNase/RNase
MQLDKVTHFLAGAVIALALGYVLPVWIAFMVAVLVGAAKEVYDASRPQTHTADVWDFVATALGGVVGGLFAFGVFA